MCNIKLLNEFGGLSNIIVVYNNGGIGDGGYFQNMVQVLTSNRAVLHTFPGILSTAVILT